jgi:hypothetical protein
MRNTDTIEAINGEQLATATDRLLFRAQVSRRSRLRPLPPSARGYLHVPLARGSQSRIAHPAPPARGSHPYLTPPARGSHPYLTPPAHGSQPRLALAPRAAQPRLAPPVRAAQPRVPFHAGAEHTLVIRPAPRAMPQVFALTLVVPALVGLALGIAALL